MILLKGPKKWLLDIQYDFTVVMWHLKVVKFGVNKIILGSYLVLLLINLGKVGEKSKLCQFGPNLAKAKFGNTAKVLVNS